MVDATAAASKAEKKPPQTTVPAKPPATVSPAAPDVYYKIYINFETDKRPEQISKDFESCLASWCTSKENQEAQADRYIAQHAKEIESLRNLLVTKAGPEAVTIALNGTPIRNDKQMQDLFAAMRSGLLGEYTDVGENKNLGGRDREGKELTMQVSWTREPKLLQNWEINGVSATIGVEQFSKDNKTLENLKEALDAMLTATARTTSLERSDVEAATAGGLYFKRPGVLNPSH